MHNAKAGSFLIVSGTSLEQRLPRQEVYSVAIPVFDD